MSDASVRAAEGPADAAAIAGIYEPYVRDTAISFEDTPPGADEIAARMLPRPGSDAQRMPWLVAVESGTIIGYAYASPHRARAAYRWAVDVSVYLAGSARGRGVGTLLYAELLPVVTALGYVKAYAGVTQPNDASVRLHRRLGFTPVGTYHAVGFKFGRWHDVAWFERSLVDPVPDAPSEPRAWKPASVPAEVRSSGPAGAQSTMP